MVAKEKCFIALLADSEKTDTLSWKIQRVSVLFLLRFQIIKLKSTSRCVLFSCFLRCMCRCFTKQYPSFRSQNNFYDISSETKPTDNQHWTIATVESPSNLAWKSESTFSAWTKRTANYYLQTIVLTSAVFSWLNVPCTCTFQLADWQWTSDFWENAWRRRPCPCWAGSWTHADQIDMASWQGR